MHKPLNSRFPPLQMSIFVRLLCLGWVIFILIAKKMLFGYWIPYFHMRLIKKYIYKTDLEVFISEVFKYTILFKYINPLCYTYVIIKIRMNFVF